MNTRKQDDWSCDSGPEDWDCNIFWKVLFFFGLMVAVIALTVYFAG